MSYFDWEVTCTTSCCDQLCMTLLPVKLHITSSAILFTNSGNVLNSWSIVFCSWLIILIFNSSQCILEDIIDIGLSRSVAPNKVSIMPPGQNYRTVYHFYFLLLVGVSFYSIALSLEQFSEIRLLCDHFNISFHS